MAEYIQEPPNLNQHRAALAGPLLPVDVGDAVTAIDILSDGEILPQAVINVDDTTGFLAAGTIFVESDEGRQVITYTGKTATSFTGATGGSGELSTGGAVTQATAVILNVTTLGWSPERFNALKLQCELDAEVKVLGLDEATWCPYPGAAASVTGGDVVVLRGRWKALKVITYGQVWLRGDLDHTAYNANL